MLGRRGGSWRRVAGCTAPLSTCPRKALIAAIACCSCGIAAPTTSANWSSTSTVRQSAICPEGPLEVPSVAGGPIAFGPRNVAWAVCARREGSGGLVVGRFTSNYRLADAQQVPGTRGVVVSAPKIAVNGSGIGVLVWLFHRPRPSGDSGPLSEGVAAVTWHIGQRPGRPIVLASELHDSWRSPSVAINSKGVAVVLLALERVRIEQQPPASVGLGGEEVVAARVRADRLLGLQQLAFTTGFLGGAPATGSLDPGTVDHVELHLTAGEGFQAAWQIIGEGPGRAAYPPLTAATAGAGPSGVFANPTAALITPLSPSSNPELGSIKEEETLRSDARGDQAFTWESGSVSGIDSSNTNAVANVYVASRRTGQLFDTPELIGTTPYGLNSPTTIIDPAGRRITVMWLGSSNELLAATGDVGGRFSPARRVANVHPDQFGGLRLALTRGDGIVATWQGPHKDIYADVSRDGAHFNTPHVFVTASGCSNPAITPDRAGGALVEWSCFSRAGSWIEQFAHFHP
jgi:hypothetical protein